MALFFVMWRYKGPALYICLWEFDREHMENNANKGRR